MQIKEFTKTQQGKITIGVVVTLAIIALYFIMAYMMNWLPFNETLESQKTTAMAKLTELDSTKLTSENAITKTNYNAEKNKIKELINKNKINVLINDKLLPEDSARQEAFKAAQSKFKELTDLLKDKPDADLKDDAIAKTFYKSIIDKLKGFVDDIKKAFPEETK